MQHRRGHQGAHASCCHNKLSGEMSISNLKIEAKIRVRFITSFDFEDAKLYWLDLRQTTIQHEVSLQALV